MRNNATKIASVAQEQSNTTLERHLKIKATATFIDAVGALQVSTRMTRSSHPTAVHVAAATAGTRVNLIHLAEHARTASLAVALE